MNLCGFIENHPGNRRPSKNLPLSGGRRSDRRGDPEDGAEAGGLSQRRGEVEGMVRWHSWRRGTNEMSDSWSGCFEGNSLRMYKIAALAVPCGSPSPWFNCRKEETWAWSRTPSNQSPPVEPQQSVSRYLSLIFPASLLLE